MIDFEELLRLLSDYFDEELEANICEEIDQLIHEDLWWQAFFNTFNKTMELCREMEEEMEVPKDVHIQLFESLRIEIRRKRKSGFLTE